jgi:hypothetical protein
VLSGASDGEGRSTGAVPGTIATMAEHLVAFVEVLGHLLGHRRTLPCPVRRSEVANSARPCGSTDGIRTAHGPRRSLPRQRRMSGGEKPEREITNIIRTVTHTPRKQAKPGRTQVVAGLHCPSWARADRPSPKKKADAVASAIAPPGLEPGLP